MLSESSVRYSITFRSINRNNKNSTIIIGDSNTHFIRFHHESRSSDLGKEIVGKRVKAYTIDQINPHDAVGYHNIVVQVGVNNLKDKNANLNGSVDIEKTFDDWLTRVVEIKRLCPKSNIIVSPVLPTRIRVLNDRAKKFNALIFSCRNSFWRTLGFNCFLDNDSDLLYENFTRFKCMTTGYKDRIHLGRRGISKLSLLIRDAVLHQERGTAYRSYANVVRNHLHTNSLAQT